MEGTFKNVLFSKVAPVQNMTPYMDVKQRSSGLEDSTKTFVGTTVWDK